MKCEVFFSLESRYVFSVGFDYIILEDILLFSTFQHINCVALLH